MINLPNLLTFSRVVLTPFILAAVLRNEYPRAIALFVIAGFSDMLDGLAARGLHTATRVGAYFDPIADKILLSALYIVFGVARALPWWMVGVVFGRDLLICAMAAFGLLFTPFHDFPPSIWGKLSTVLQILAALAVMIARIGPKIPLSFILGSMIAVTIWSGIHYVLRGISLLRSQKN